MTNEVISAVGISLAVVSFGVYHFSKKIPIKKVIKVASIVLLVLVVVGIVVGLGVLLLGEVN